MEAILVFFRCEIGYVSGTTLMFWLNETEGDLFPYGVFTNLNVAKTFMTIGQLQRYRS